MKNTDIEKIRQLLKTALCPNITNGCQDGIMPNPYGEMEQCQWCEKRKQALALLPCPTCNGLGAMWKLENGELRAKSNTPRDMLGIEVPCPNCYQPKIK